MAPDPDITSEEQHLQWLATHMTHASIPALKVCLHVRLFRRVIVCLFVFFRVLFVWSVNREFPLRGSLPEGREGQSYLCIPPSSLSPTLFVLVFTLSSWQSPLFRNFWTLAFQFLSRFSEPSVFISIPFHPQYVHSLFFLSASSLSIFCLSHFSPSNLSH